MPDITNSDLRDALEHVAAEGFGDNVDYDSIIEQAARAYLESQGGNPPASGGHVVYGLDDPEAHYFPDPNGNYPIGGDEALSYQRLTKHIQQAGEHAMIHGHAEDADVFCMDHDCEVWKPNE